MHVYIFLEASQQNSSKHIGSPTENPKGVREHWGKEVFFDLPSLCAAFLFFFSVLFVCFLARNSSLSLFVNIVPATFNFASHVQRNSYAFFLCLTLAVLFIHLPETTMVTGLRLFSVTKFLVLDLQHLHQFFQRFMRKIPVMWPSFHSNLPEKSLPFLDRSGILSHRTEVIVGECAWLKVGLGRWENGE